VYLFLYISSPSFSTRTHYPHITLTSKYAIASYLLFTNHQQLQLQNWRTNCDIQLITRFRECIEYVTKYAAKGEPQSNAVKEAFRSVMETSTSQSSVKQALNKIIMKSLGQRDFAAQETMHHLLSLKLVSSSFKVVTVILEGSRKVH